MYIYNIIINQCLIQFYNLFFIINEHSVKLCFSSSKFEAFSKMYFGIILIQYQYWQFDIILKRNPNGNFNIIVSLIKLIDKCYSN